MLKFELLKDDPAAPGALDGAYLVPVIAGAVIRFGQTHVAGVLAGRHEVGLDAPAVGGSCASIGDLRRANLTVERRADRGEARAGVQRPAVQK